MALCPGLPGRAGIRKVKPIWILLKQETVSGSGMQVSTLLQTNNHANTPPLSFLQAGWSSCCQPIASKHWKQDTTRGKVLSWEYRSPRKRNSRPPVSIILCSVSWVKNVLLIYYASGLFTLEIGLFTLEKNPRITAFLDSNLHTRLAIVTANELGLAFPSRNRPKKFRPDPSTFYLVIVVTDRQTDRRTDKQRDRQTYASDYIIPR